MYEYYSFKNIKILVRTDKLVLMNESTFCSLAPILFLIKIFTKIDIYVFAMGLYSKKLKFPKLRKFHFMFINLFSSIATNMFFLGEGEYKNALETHPKFKDKYVLFPFSVDTAFLEIQKIYQFMKEKKYCLLEMMATETLNCLLKLLNTLKILNLMLSQI